MPTQYKTPGVYIVEKNAFPPSVVAVETAVPAFVGYTEKAEFKGKPLTNVPFRLSSMTEFEAAFGGPPMPRFRIVAPAAASAVAAQAVAAPVKENTAVSKPLAIADPAAPSQAEIDAIKAAVAEATTVDDPSKTELGKLALGTAVTQPQKDALEALNKAISAATPVETAVGKPLAIADPAAPSQAEIDAIKAAVAEATTLDDPSKTELGKLALGTAVTQPQKDALEALNKAIAAATPVEKAVSKPLAIADPSAPSQAEIDAIKAAVATASTLDDPSKTELGKLALGTAVTQPQKDALEALNKAIAAASPPVDAPEADDAPAAAIERGWVFKVNKQEYKIERTDPQFLLYYAMRQFFDNGGGPCWIVSVGIHADEKIEAGAKDKGGLADGIEKLKDEIEPTMLVIPDAVRLDAKNCNSLQQAMLMHCGYDMKNRFAILDIHDGDQPIFGGNSPVDAFRSALGVNNLNYGAAYYPWLNTTVVQERDIGYQNFLDPQNLETSAQALLNLIDAGHQAAGEKPEDTQKRKAVVVSKPKDETGKKLDEFLKASIPSEPSDEQAATINQVNQLLVATSEAFKTMRTEALRQLNLLPPSGAMAGLYTFVDNSRGVWKAPANISVNGAVSPAVPISALAQQGLNVDPMGKSINAIRSFIGEGVLVWGARTLDGNSLDWRYINVRRTMIFLEESCKLAAKRMVFEPNVSSTWVTIKAMIENFLTSVWRQGGLAGAVPTDAFSVHVGLGDTMTADDILEGILRVTVLVAISRPAEFIEITFQQQLQKS